jgi:hypothetical protein
MRVLVPKGKSGSASHRRETASEDSREDLRLVISRYQDLVVLMDCPFHPSHAESAASRLGERSPRSVGTRNSRRVTSREITACLLFLQKRTFSEILPQHIVQAVALSRLKSCGLRC